MEGHTEAEHVRIHPVLPFRAEYLMFYKALILPDTLYASNAYFSSLCTQQPTITDECSVCCITYILFPAHTGHVYTCLGLGTVVERGESKLHVLAFRVRSGMVGSLTRERLPNCQVAALIPRMNKTWLCPSHDASPMIADRLYMPQSCEILYLVSPSPFVDLNTFDSKSKCNSPAKV